jgi:hypothetical protein
MDRVTLVPHDNWYGFPGDQCDAALIEDLRRWRRSCTGCNGCEGFFHELGLCDDGQPMLWLANASAHTVSTGCCGHPDVQGLPG